LLVSQEVTVIKKENVEQVMKDETKSPQPQEPSTKVTSSSSSSHYIILLTHVSKSLEESTTSITTSPSSQLHDSIILKDESLTALKTRIIVSLGKECKNVCWYGETPPKTIEDAIRKAFKLSFHATLSLRNHDGDIVAIASTLPDGEQFALDVSEEMLSSNINFQESKAPAAECLKEDNENAKDATSPSKVIISLSTVL
jgi:hypothetical protein